MDFQNLASSLSMRSFARLGSGISCFGKLLTGDEAKVSVVNWVIFGSSISLRSYAQFGGQLSVHSFERNTHDEHESL